jgi:hypothetical protein
MPASFFWSSARALEVENLVMDVVVVVLEVQNLAVVIVLKVDEKGNA